MSGAPADKCKVPRAFWRAVERVGLPPSAVLRQARLPATLHLDGQGLVTTAQYFALWNALEELSAAPALGIKLVVSADTAIIRPRRSPHSMHGTIATASPGSRDSNGCAHLNNCISLRRTASARSPRSGFTQLNQSRPSPPTSPLRFSSSSGVEVRDSALRPVVSNLRAPIRRAVCIGIISDVWCATVRRAMRWS